VVIAAADASRVADPDIWGHLLFGQAILSHGHLAHNNVYSYSAPGSVWVDHEWLSEVVMALSYRWGGVLGLKLLKFTCVAAIVLFSSIALGATGASPAMQQIILFTEALALWVQVQCRPELLSLALLSWLLMLLARDTYRGSARLWLAIPVFVIWANLHGGFTVSLAVLGVYAGITAIQDAIARRGFKRAIKLGSIMVGATLATLINPYGLGLWTNVLHTVSNSLIRQIVDEWHPLLPILARARATPDVLIICLPTLLLMLSLAICIVLQPDARDLALVAIAGLLSASAFYAARNLRLATISVGLPLAFHGELVGVRGFSSSWRDLLQTLKSLWNGSRAGSTSLNIPSGLRPRQACTTNAANDQRSGTSPLLVASAAIALATCTGLFSSELRAAPGTSYPVGAIAFLKQHHLRGNLLCDYNWAGYVIWHTWPGSKVFIDGRCETVYPASVIRDYIRFRFGLTGAAQVLKDYPHDYVLVPPNSKAYSVTITEPNWQLLYRDSQAAVFGHAGLKSAELPSQRFAGPLPQFRFP